MWLSPAWLSLRGNLPAQAPGSGQELDSSDCLPQLDATWWGGGGRWDSAGGCLVIEENRGGTEDAEVVVFPGSSASLLQCLRLPLPPPRPVFFLQDHIPVPYQPDSSSNPSSTTSSTPSSPAPPLPPSATPPSPLHPSPQCTRQQKNLSLPGTSCAWEVMG